MAIYVANLFMKLVNKKLQVDEEYQGSEKIEFSIEIKEGRKKETEPKITIVYEEEYV